MSDLPRPVQERLQKSLGEHEPIVAGAVASMFYTPLVALLGTVFAIALGITTSIGLVGAFIVWVPLLTLIVTLYPHVTAGPKPPIKAFPGGALLLVVTDTRLLIYRYGAFRLKTDPIWEEKRDGKIKVVATDLPGPGPGAGIVISAPGGELKVAVWRLGYTVNYVQEANKVTRSS